MPSDLRQLHFASGSDKKKDVVNKRNRLIILIVLAFLLFLIIRSWNNSDVFNYVFRGTTLKTEEGRVNILLLGIAGGNHEGATLTDTIMVASYDLRSHQADLISLPRDLWLNKYQAKVNTLYQTGLAKAGSSSSGLEFARKEIGELLGIDIPYAVVVDFSGFVKAVDLVNGLDVNVGRSFDDYKYPIEGKEVDLCGSVETEVELDQDRAKRLGLPEGKQKIYLSPDGQEATDAASLDLSCRYEHISFKQGLTHLSGTTALKFVRSRTGTNNEGSDFARSRRLQLVLQAFKERVLSLDILTDLSRVINLVQTFGQSIVSDIPPGKYPELISLARKIASVRSHVIDASGENPLLIHPDTNDYAGAWVLIPPNNDFFKIKALIDDIQSGKNQATISGELK